MQNGATIPPIRAVTVETGIPGMTFPDIGSNATIAVRSAIRNARELVR